MLILAAVAINLTIGNNGIFTRAQNATKKWEEASKNEQDEMDKVSNFLDEYMNGNSGEEDDNKGPIKVTLKIEGEKVTPPPLPSSDFTYVEGTIDTGYVIQDGEGNQFVWVPVDKNQKIKINVTAEEKIDSISLTDPYGDEIQLANANNLGTTYNNENVEPTINGPYRLTVTSGGETKKVFLNVHSLYALDTAADWFFTEEVANAQGAPSLDDLLMGYTLEQAYIEYGKTFKEFSETEDYKQSVNENGGFYIARYEASYEKGKVASKVSTSTRKYDTTPLEDGMLWNDISQTDALAKANEMYTSEEFTSSLPTGAAWDRTLSWLEETGAVSIVEIVGDSKTWGNYEDDTFSNTPELINTGKYSQTEKNHIYDLAGNLLERTTEVYSTSCVSRRWLHLRFRFSDFIVVSLQQL